MTAYPRAASCLCSTNIVYLSQIFILSDDSVWRLTLLRAAKSVHYERGQYWPLTMYPVPTQSHLWLIPALCMANKSIKPSDATHEVSYTHCCANCPIFKGLGQRFVVLYVSKSGPYPKGGGLKGSTLFKRREWSRKVTFSCVLHCLFSIN